MLLHIPHTNTNLDQKRDSLINMGVKIIPLPSYWDDMAGAKEPLFALSYCPQKNTNISVENSENQVRSIKVKYMTELGEMF